MSKFTKKCMAIWTLSDTASGLPYISLLILTFLNCCISVKTSLTNTKLGNLAYHIKPSMMTKPTFNPVLKKQQELPLATMYM